MCNWCSNLEVAKELIKINNYSGHTIGKQTEFKPWSENDIIKIQLWYEREYGMKERDFLIELSYSENNNGSSRRFVAPIKFCPNCGKKLTQ